MTAQPAPQQPAPEKKCPVCQSEEHHRRRYRMPGMEPDDWTCSWHECDDCGFKEEPS